MRRALKAALGGVLLAACGIEAVGSAPGARPEPENDAAPANDAPIGNVDGPEQADAATDGETLDAPNDAPLTFCQKLTMPATFCADFDDPSDASPGAGWETTFRDTDGSVTITDSTSTFASAPRALHVTSTQGANAGLRRSFVVTSSISVELDARFVAVLDSGVVGPLRVTPPTQIAAQDFYFYTQTFDSYFQQYDKYSNLALPTLAPNTWHHIALSMVASGGNWIVNASLDGVSGWANHTMDHPWTKPVTIDVDVGLILYTVQSDEAYVDNVVIRVQ